MSALLVELTVPWDEGMEAAQERKMVKYSDLVAECREGGWSLKLNQLNKATRELTEEVEKTSFWLC